MGSQSQTLVVGRKYHLISDSKSQSWNDGICVLDSIDKNRALVTKLNTNTQFNVPSNSLYDIIKFICIKEDLEWGCIIGHILELSNEYYENSFLKEFYKPLHEFREERINQILE